MINRWKIAWRDALWVFGLSRLVIVLVSLITMNSFHISSFLLPNDVIRQNATLGLGRFWDSWWRWDVVHYVHIAEGGYSSSGLTAFFPFFPLLMNIFGRLGGGSAFADYIAGLLLANLCFLGALVLFHRLICQDFDQIVARNALFFLAFSPYGIFFFAGYTESLFLLLSLAAFFFLQQGRTQDWWLAGLCSFFASLTRSTGIVLIIPLIILFLQKFVITQEGVTSPGQCCIKISHGRAKAGPSFFMLKQYLSYLFSKPFPKYDLHSFFSRERLLAMLNAIFAMLLVPAGLLTYMLYLRIHFGNPFLYAFVEKRDWHRNFTFPWESIMMEFKSLSFPVYQTETNIVDLIFTLFPLITLFIEYWRIRWQYTLFSLGLMLMALCFPCWKAYEVLQSMPRYLFVAFPLYLIFALWSKTYQKISSFLFIIFIAFFIINTILFVTQSWVA